MEQPSETWSTEGADMRVGEVVLVACTADLWRREGRPVRVQEVRP